MPAVQRAVLDLAARIEGDDLAPAEPAADLHALVGKEIAELAPAGRHEIGRPAKQRGGELAGRPARAFDDRLIIAGEEAVAVAELADAQRPEIVLEELARAVLLERDGRERPPADVFEFLGDRRLAAGPPLAVQRPAAREKSRESGGVVIIRPTVELRPVDRLVLSVGKFDRLALGAAGRRHAGETDQQ